MASLLGLISASGLLSLWVLLYLGAVSVGVVEGRTSEHLKVRLPHGGVLIGRHMSSHKGRGVRAFLGVPYAQPPLGDLRFKAPVPFGPWTGDRKAIHDPDMCVQRDPYRRDYELSGSEDCLYLNVYTPQEPKTSGPLPVMVWFHGGGFMCGSGKHAFYGHEFLLDHDVIYIGGNYRVGPLGFLSTETLDSPGNYGLKDQVAILRWIKENIASFGGDPNSVTLFGESAGGASVTYHMMSAQSQGLFHRGIAMSGTYFNPWAQPAYKGVAAKRARQLSKLVGCGHDGNWQQIMACLRTKSAEDVTATFYEFFEWDTDPMVPFPPVVEPAHPEAFMSVHPRSVKEPHGFKLPLMIGVTTDEGLLKSASMFGLEGLLDDFKQNIDRAMPLMLYYDHHDPPVLKQITDKLNEFYFKDGHTYTDHTNHHNLTNVISDSWFLAGIDEYLRLRLKSPSSKAATYVYQFEQQGAASLSELFKGGDEVFYGVSHADDLQYLFPVGRELFFSSSPSKGDIEVREVMLQLWTSFARGSNPTPSDSQLPKWLPTKSYPATYVHIGKSEANPLIISEDTGLMQDRSDFWHALNPFLPSKSGHSIDRNEL